jgi:hypothetical protein
MFLIEAIVDKTIVMIIEEVGQQLNGLDAGSLQYSPKSLLAE